MTGHRALMRDCLPPGTTGVEALKVSDAAVMAAVPLPAPLQIVRWLRLCLFAKIVVTGGTEIRALIIAGTRDHASWLRNV